MDTPKRPEVLSFSQGTCSTMVIYSWDPSLIEAVNPLVSLIESGQGPILSDINTSGSELDALKTGWLILQNWPIMTYHIKDYAWLVLESLVQINFMASHGCPWCPGVAQEVDQDGAGRWICQFGVAGSKSLAPCSTRAKGKWWQMVSNCIAYLPLYFCRMTSAKILGSVLGWNHFDVGCHGDAVL